MMSRLLNENEYCCDHFHLGENHHSSLFPYSSTDGLTSYSYLPSSASLSSMDELKFGSFDCDVGGSEDDISGTSLDFNEEEPKFFTACSNDEVETIDRYPSGRIPLIPLKVDVGNSEQEKHRYKVHKANEANEDQDNDYASESLSWLSRTLCVARTNSTFHSENQNDDVGGCNEGMAQFFEDDIENVPNQVRDTSKLDEDLRSDEKTVQRENKVKAKEISPMKSLDTFFRRNNILCDSLTEWYNMIDANKESSSVADNCVARKRSTNITERKKKVVYLRKNLAPFDIDQIELKEGSINTEKYSPCELGSIRFSFSNSNPSKTSKQLKPPQTDMISSDKRKSSSMITRGCGDFSNIIDLQVSSSEEDLNSTEFNENNLGYDSDPCDLMPTHQSPSRRSKKKLNCQPRSVYNFDGKFDDFECLQKICKHMNSKRVLIWHRPSTDDKIFHPIAVHAWIELGSQLDNALIQPKFCWRKSYEKDINDRSILTISRFNAVDLLDISKVVAVGKSTSRTKYPYVQRKSSFVVEAFGREFLFQARDQIERDDIVEGLKLLVARLGSKILMGDIGVLDEFFSPLGASVPGRIPPLFTEKL